MGQFGSNPAGVSTFFCCLEEARIWVVRTQTGGGKNLALNQDRFARATESPGHSGQAFDSLRSPRIATLLKGAQHFFSAKDSIGPASGGNRIAERGFLRILLRKALQCGRLTAAALQLLLCIGIQTHWDG
jgi:hypothetical protein